MNRKITTAVAAIVLVGAFSVLLTVHVGRGTAASRCDQTVVIGDSLTAFGNLALRNAIPNVTINARGGRLTSEAWEAGEGYSQSSEGWDLATGVPVSKPSTCWIFALGTNDVFFNVDHATYSAAIAKMLTLVSANDRVWWVEPVFASSVHRDPAAFIATIPAFVTKIDPSPASSDFRPDGIHLTSFGYEHRAEMIAAALG